MLPSGGCEPPGRSPLAEALAWLAEHAHENLGTEIALRSVAGEPDQWRVAVTGPGGGPTGVAVWAPGGQWFLEAENEAATSELARVVAQAGESWPVKVTTSGTVKQWLRPWLAEQGACVRITREHDLLAMECRTARRTGAGRWATHADRPSLERYQAAYNEERGTATMPDWHALLGRPNVAVLERGGRIVAVVKRTADTARYATIGGTWTDPRYRRRGFGARLTAFITAALLAERPAVHLVVDDDNTAAIGLYRSIGFERAGCCYMAYLSGDG